LAVYTRRACTRGCRKVPPVSVSGRLCTGPKPTSSTCGGRHKDSWPLGSRPRSICVHYPPEVSAAVRSPSTSSPRAGEGDVHLLRGAEVHGPPATPSAQASPGQPPCTIRPACSLLGWLSPDRICSA